MAQMGKYCKAYPVERFAAFPQWSVDESGLRADRKRAGGDGADAQAESAEPTFFYLQENYTVTDDIFLDENVVFGNVTPEWVEFCKNDLGFEVPAYEGAAAEDGASAESEQVS